MKPSNRWGVVGPRPQKTFSKKVLIWEIFIVLMLTLGENAVRALLKIVSLATQPNLGLNNLNGHTVVMSGVYSEQIWYDWALHLMTLFFSCVPVVLIVWLFHNSNVNVRELWAKSTHWIHWTDFLRATAMACFVGGLGILFYLGSHYMGFAATITVGDSLETWRYWVFLLMDSLSTSILEEFVVVGYLLVRLCQLGWRVEVALVLSSLFRGMYHLYQGLWGFIGNFFMGLAFGYLYLRWGRIMPLVIAHFIMDGIAFMGLALLAPQLPWLPS